MILPTLDIEKSLWNSGHSYVCGLDEVGRGSFAGPVVVGAVIFPKNCRLIDGIADSKALKPLKRQMLAKEIKKNAVAWAIAEISVPSINKIGIGRATQAAFRKALRSLDKFPDFVLIDAFYIEHFNRKYQKPIKNGDKICASISAASIIAKVYRDDLMKKLHKKYPNYSLSKNKGYGTKIHRDAIRKYGLSKLHRKSFNLEKFL